MTKTANMSKTERKSAGGKKYHEKTMAKSKIKSNSVMLLLTMSVRENKHKIQIYKLEKNPLELCRLFLDRIRNA